MINVHMRDCVKWSCLVAGGLCDCIGSRSSSACERLVWRMGPAITKSFWCQRIVPHCVRSSEFFPMLVHCCDALYEPLPLPLV